MHICTQIDYKKKLPTFLCVSKALSLNLTCAPPQEIDHFYRYFLVRVVGAFWLFRLGHCFCRYILVS